MRARDRVRMAARSTKPFKLSWDEKTASGAADQLGRADIRQLRLGWYMAEHKIDVMTTRCQGTRKADLRQWHARERKPGNNDADLHVRPTALSILSR
jgi:hypothetical protein